MQTFLPFEDFALSAKVLDRQRLGKQRVECKQILRAMHLGGGWKNHPAVRMWRGHTASLVKYYYTIVDEWVARGYKHNMTLDYDAYAWARMEVDVPPWLGIETFHERHRAMLVYKNPTHYIPLFQRIGSLAWYQPVSEPGYWWPPPEESGIIPTTIKVDESVPF